MGINPWGMAARRAAEEIKHDRLKQLEAAGINYDFLVKKLLEELEAKEARFFACNGYVVDARAVPNWNIRQKARMDAHRLRGDYPAEKIEGELNMPDLNEILLSEYGIRRKKARVKK